MTLYSMRQTFCTHGQLLCGEDKIFSSFHKFRFRFHCPFHKLTSYTILFDLRPSRKNGTRENGWKWPAFVQPLRTLSCSPLSTRFPCIVDCDFRFNFFLLVFYRFYVPPLSSLTLFSSIICSKIATGQSYVDLLIIIYFISMNIL